MVEVPLQYNRMACAADEYCDLIDGFGGFCRDRQWLPRMTKLLPRLHVAVISISHPSDACLSYHFPNDDARCELYMHLHSVMDKDIFFWSGRSGLQIRHTLCERLADDLTDMYFDIKYGLEVIEHDPRQAVSNWLCSFYLHWGRHLLDAEYWLRAVDGDSRMQPV